LFGVVGAGWGGGLRWSSGIVNSSNCGLCRHGVCPPSQGRILLAKQQRLLLHHLFVMGRFILPLCETSLLGW
jgi:hypothetical protein